MDSVAYWCVAFFIEKTETFELNALGKKILFLNVYVRRKLLNGIALVSVESYNWSSVSWVGALFCFNQVSKSFLHYRATQYFLKFIGNFFLLIAKCLTLRQGPLA